MSNITVDKNNWIVNGEDRINPKKGDRVGDSTQFVKTYYLHGGKTPEGESDVLLLVTKDEYHNKYLQVVDDPRLEFFVTKPEIWEQSDGSRVNYLPKEHVNQYTCSYRDRLLAIPDALGDQGLYREVERLLNEYSYENRRAAEDLINLDARVHNSDMNIEDQYIYYLLKKYPYDENSDKLRKGFYDIEVDGTGITGFPEPEEAKAPVNMISYFDDVSMTMYSYVLKYDTDTYRDFQADKDRIIGEMQEEFSERGFEVEFVLEECDTEEELLSKFLYTVNEVTLPDFCVAFNADFDFPTIYNRLDRLGIDPKEAFSPVDFPYKDAYYRLDTRGGPADRDSIFMTTSYTTWMDQLALYAQMEFGTLESYSLEHVAQQELGRGKKDFDGEITDGFLVNYEKFFRYNVEDTFLLFEIEHKVQHLDLLYFMSLLTSTRPTHVLKKTVSLRNYANIYYEDSGYVMSNNHSSTYEKAGGKIQGG